MSRCVNLDYDGEDFTITIDDREYILRGCEWRPENQPEFVLIYVHEQGSFVTTAHTFIDLVVKNKGVFIGCDHMGHGRSSGPRAGCTIEEICEETEQIIIKAHDSFPNIPIFLYGFSSGATACLQLILERANFISQYVNNVILESPYISSPKGNMKISFIQSFWIMVLAKLFPYTIMSIGEDYTSSDTNQNFAKRCYDSPLFSPFSTPIFLDSFLKSITAIRDAICDWPIDINALFLQGKKDQTIDLDSNIAWFNELVMEKSHLSEGIIKFNVYDNLSHSLLKSNSNEKVFEDIFNFIHKHKQ